jgi:hypothetical protein
MYLLYLFALRFTLLSPVQTFFAERFFTLFDDNGDGMIDMKELIAGLELLANGTVADKLTFLFRVYDIDGMLTTTVSRNLDNANRHAIQTFPIGFYIVLF